jgi:hypothetical protein
MLTPPKRQEVDHRTIKLIVGVVALSLAALTDLFAKTRITSISASYYEGGWSQSIFIGFLFAISALMLAYNGRSEREMVLSKVAAAAGLGIALFPCVCGIHTPPIPFVHGASAAVMFLILAYFCYLFSRRARSKNYSQAKLRSGIYVACAIAIVLSIVVIALDHVSGGTISARLPRLVFYGEATGLVAFGISWLTASRVLPVITAKEERFSPLRDVNPD